MPKFYIHRSTYCWVTEVTEIEAPDADEAMELIFNGEGKYLGHSVGDSAPFADNESIEILDAAPHNLPAVFLPAQS